MDEEQPVRIVFLLDFRQVRIVAAPVSLLKFVLEVITLAYVRSTVRHNSPEFIHALTNASGTRSTAVKSWLKSGNARIRRPLRSVVTADGQIRLANACTNPDLFWALKGGGGGSFAVVSKVTAYLLSTKGCAESTRAKYRRL